jgi:hypothetical protein
MSGHFWLSDATSHMNCLRNLFTSCLDYAIEACHCSSLCARTLDALPFLYQVTTNQGRAFLTPLLLRIETIGQWIWPRLDLFLHRKCHILCAFSPVLWSLTYQCLSDFPLSFPVPTELGTLCWLLVATRLFHHIILCYFHTADPAIPQSLALYSPSSR